MFASTATTLGLRVAAPTVIAGHAGLTDARFDVTLLDNGNGVPSPLTISYGQGGGTATPGSQRWTQAKSMRVFSPLHSIFLAPREVTKYCYGAATKCR